MAQRRMFSNRIANSARFLQMPSESQLLYFHLVLRADDDGIVESYPLMKMLSIAPDSFKVLLAKKFIRQLNEDQVVVVMDWTEHNLIRADRKVNSIYQHLLIGIPEVKIIEPKPRADRPEQLPENRTNDKGRPKEINGTEMGRHRLGKCSIGKDNKEREVPPSPEDFFGNLEAQEKVINWLVSEKGVSMDLAKKEIAKFVAYWTEPNLTGKKVRWQGQKFFDIRRRLVTWFMKMNNFAGQSAGKTSRFADMP